MKERDENTPKWYLKWKDGSGKIDEMKVFTDDIEWTKQQVGRNRFIIEWIEVRKLKCPNHLADHDITGGIINSWEK
jgi:hypothetical protein|tara:strand:- start:664 stop:891 length:228 start_codon:yes stop_codon:yes gene_type:complete